LAYRLRHQICLLDARVLRGTFSLGVTQTKRSLSNPMNELSRSLRECLRRKKEMAVSQLRMSDESVLRKSGSVPYHAKIEVSVSSGAHFVGEAIGISMASISLCMDEPLRLHDMVQLQLPLLSTGQSLSVTATVEQKTGSMYACHFMWLSPEDHKALAGFLRRLVAQTGPPKPFIGLKSGDYRSPLPIAVHSNRRKPRIASLWTTAMAFLKAS
jgi:PilZ domain